MTIQWLHAQAPRGWHPQMGFATLSKTTKLWLPGNRQAGSLEWITNKVRDCPLIGTSQFCFRSLEKPQQQQTALITHIAIDVDDDPDMAKIHLSLDGFVPYSVRTSQSGKGLHVFVRLATSIELPYADARALVKSFTKPIVERLESVGQKVCSYAPRLMFVLGGKQEWVMQNNELWAAPAAQPAPDTATGLRHLQELQAKGEPTPMAKALADLALGNPVGRHQCHVGTVVKQLRAMGETVVTKSRMSGTNTAINGFLEVGAGWVSLFSNPDGKVIWRWSSENDGAVGDE